MSDFVSPLTDDTPEERHKRLPHCKCEVFRLANDSGGIVLAGQQLHTADRCGFFTRLSVVWSADGQDFNIAVVWRDA